MTSNPRKRTAAKKTPAASVADVKVDLAYPWTGPDGTAHDPDDTVTVDRATARTLIRDGRARPSQSNTDVKE